MGKGALRAAVVAACATLLSSAAVAHELQVGRTSDNQLALHMDGGPPFFLPQSQFRGFDGYAAAEPGFVSNEDVDPDNNFFPLLAGVDLEFELVAAEPHIQVWNDTGSAPMIVGERYTIGGQLFHNHPIWHSPDGTPNVEYTLQIRLVDLSGQLSDSPVYSIGFIPTPEPAAGLLLVLGAAWALRRR